MIAIKDNTDYWIDQCLDGEQYAYKMLYDNYVKAMLNTAYRLLQNEDLAHDAVQEAFIKAFQKLDTFKRQSTFGSWLKRIVVNNCLSVMRKSNGYMVELKEQDDAIEQPTEHDYPDLTVEDIKVGIGKLSEGYRVVLTLVLFEEYSHQQVAEELGISASTSRTQYMRAKEKLKTILLESYGR